MPTLFRRYEWCLSALKKMSFCRVIKSVIMFFSCYDACCMWDFSPFSLSFLRYYNLVLLVVSISILIPVILISFFLSWLFCRSFIFFQFHIWILIYQLLYSPIWSSFFEFLIFYLGHFIKVLLVFNFIIQFKFLVLCFSIWSLLFWFLILFFILL
jgi:hypothetical protein